eukprot:6187423-Pleurochrysis_carterae.AAC.2
MGRNNLQAVAVMVNSLGADATAEHQGEAAIQIVGERVRETPADPNLLHCKGLIYMQTGNQFCVGLR